MNKVFDLYRYLKLSGFNRELEILKTALETTPEELEEAFPQLFRFYEEGKPTAMFGGVFAQINKYIEEEYITQQEIDAIQTFDLLKQKMKELKSLKKETEAKFKYLNEYDIEQKFKDLAKEKKLSKEDFEFAYKSFIAENEDNHELEQSIVIVADLREKYRLLKEKINTIEDNEDLLSRLADPLSYKTLNGASTEINNLMMNVNNIIQGRQSGGLKKKLLNYYDYIYNGENKLNYDYPEERRGKAKETSKVLYNDGDLAIVNSWSEEACQYWERGAVSVSSNRVSFRTCTSSIAGVHGLTNENLYRGYSRYTVIQVLKLENGQPKFYEGPNEMLTLCFGFKDNNFEMKERGSASVNANDRPVDEVYFSKIFPKAYAFLKKYISKSENKTNLLSPETFFYNKYKMSKDIFDSFEYKKAMDLNERTFFSFRDKGLISDDVFNSFVNEKAKKLDSEVFLQKEIRKLIPEDIFVSFVTVKLKEFLSNSENIVNNNIVKYLEKYFSAKDFFEYSDKIPKSLSSSLAKEKAKELSPNDFFKYRRKINRVLFKSLAGKKAKEASPEAIFERGNIRALIKSPSISKEELKNLIISKEKELPSDAKLSHSILTLIKKIIPQEVFSDIFKKRYEEDNSI